MASHDSYNSIIAREFEISFVPSHVLRAVLLRLPVVNGSFLLCWRNGRTRVWPRVDRRHAGSVATLVDNLRESCVSLATTVLFAVNMY